MKLERQLSQHSGDSQEKVTVPFEVQEHYLDLKKKIEAFSKDSSYDVQIENSFEFFPSKIASLAEEYENFTETDKIKAKEFIVTSLELLKNKAEEFEVYAEKNQSLSPIMKPKDAYDKYMYAYRKAQEQGLI